MKKRRNQKITPNDKELNRLSDELSVHDEDDEDSLNITRSRSLVAIQQAGNTIIVSAHIFEVEVSIICVINFTVQQLSKCVRLW